MIGDVVDVVVLRNGKKISKSIEIEDPRDRQNNTLAIHPLLRGLEVSMIANRSGVVITKLAPNSLVAYSGLRLGDAIYGVNRKRINDLTSFRLALNENSDSILFQIERNGRSFLAVVRR